MLEIDYGKCSVPLRVQKEITEEFGQQYLDALLQRVNSPSDSMSDIESRKEELPCRCVFTKSPKPIIGS